MNQIIKSYLETHKKEYALDDYDLSTLFEHFINKCIVNRMTLDRFDPKNILTEEGEIGVDGIAIIVNEQLVNDLEDCRDIYSQNRDIKVKFVFIQAKTSDKFDGGDINTFFKGIKHFFEPDGVRPITNSKIENLIKIKNYIYEQIINQSNRPILEMYYVTCGKWNDGNNLTNNINTDIRYFKDTGDFLDVLFFPYDNEKIITLYTEMRRKISRTFMMEKKLPFFTMPGIKVGYFGLVRCRDVANLLTDSQGNLFCNIFEDNVRDFQGYNQVNSEIKSTILDKELQERFSVLNNGITIIAKNIDTNGDIITIFDYQIVNGCQTSRVLFDNKDMLSENSCVLAKIIQVDSEDILDKIVYTSNRQTEVKYEAFSSANRFHKLLQEYYTSIPYEYRLFYERRSKQYDMDSSIDKNRIITLAMQTFSYISMFLNEPHSLNRYYGELLNAYKKRIYNEDDVLESYYISAYYLYCIDKCIKNGIINKKFKRFKYHISCAMRSLLCSSMVLRGNSKEIKREALKLIDISRDKDLFIRNLNTACTCINATMNELQDVPEYLMHRSKEFTNKMIKIIHDYKDVKDSDMYLKVGDIVSCQVTAIRNYTIEVELRTDDLRKYGSIHIKNIANRYIYNISDEAQLGEILQAKIINDYDSKIKGWDLSLII